MNSWLNLFALLVTGLVCSQGLAAEDANSLSESERTSGFVLLFDSKDLAFVACPRSEERGLETGSSEL